MANPRANPVTLSKPRCLCSLVCAGREVAPRITHRERGRVPSWSRLLGPIVLSHARGGHWRAANADVSPWCPRPRDKRGQSMVVIVLSTSWRAGGGLEARCPPGGARRDAPPLHRSGRSPMLDVRREVLVSGTVCAAAHRSSAPCQGQQVGRFLLSSTHARVPAGPMASLSAVLVLLSVRGPDFSPHFEGHG